MTMNTSPMDHPSAPDEQVEIAIVGGGIIGLVLTVGLLRVGAKVKVYEQAQGFREIGAGIAFTANAIRCMHLIDGGIPVALRSSGSVATSNGGEEDPNDYLRWIDGFDRKRGDEPRGQRLLYKLDAGYRGFEGCRRDQFLEALVKIVPPDVVELKKRLESITDGGGADEKLRLAFADGTTAEADIVIGCDGVKSRVRRILLGEDHPASRPSYTHCVAYRTLIPMERAVKALGRYKATNQHNHVGPGANLLHYPVAGNSMLNAVAFVRDRRRWPDERQTVAEGSKADVEAAFEGWCPAVRELIDLFPDTLTKWGIFDLWEYPVPRYHGRSICLAGDAAHASSPHHGAGACVGVEDALCLTTLVEAVVADMRGRPETKRAALDAALTTYDAVRRTRSQWVVNSSRRVCDLHQQREWADDDRLVKAETCFEEIRDRSLKIWHFEYEAMMDEALEGYKRRRRSVNSNRGKKADVY
ncbi:hypothetical protein DCS_05929 [Drechmeria coniospora]|uniref:FAD-binding domain-containing protein n=1 Tax=Drechmeria coniospora TaxID=98403 RepID=A0A151GA69_DRECN|nr:hypothetical protein DCS_05929 [Drechmeria coniospora]KYK53980.1 hypothetical protein DCS_05929 [Drechmeria coniospora]